MSDSKKSKDETVDGAKIAAQILNRMSTPNKEKIMKAIGELEPELSAKIQSNLFTFEDIRDVTAKGLQRLVAEVSQQDLVISMKRASTELKTALLNNMSERRRQSVVEDVKNAPPVRATEVDEAQKRIIDKVEELRDAGLLQTESKKDVWA